MKQRQRSFFSDYYIRPLIPFQWFFVSLFVALLSGFFLFRHATYDTLSAQIINTGFDQLRSQLIAALLLTLGTAVISTMLTTYQFGSMLGANIVFFIKYILPFIQNELLPVTDPGGNPELLNSGALVHTCFVIGALALLSAFMGSAIGLSLYEVLLDLPYKLLYAVKQRNTRRKDIADQPTQIIRAQVKKTVWRPERWAAIVLMVIIFILSSQSADLFFISPDVGLHNPPKLVSGNSQIPAFGTVKIVQMHSKVLGNHLRAFSIYFPPSYFTRINKYKRYPSLYLLHGSPGTIMDWIKAGDAANSANALIATKKIQELIIVMPDGNGAPGATSEWGNSSNQKQMLENYVSYELIHYVDQHFRTIPDAEHRAIGGLSMGGFGSMNIAVHHPDIFNWVISLGGYYNAMGTIWGSDVAYLQYNSAIIQIGFQPQARKLHIFLGDAYEDNPYYSDTLRYAQRLSQLGIKYTFIKEHGHHSWKVWAIQLYQALEWLQWNPIHRAPKLITRARLLPTVEENTNYIP